MNTPSWAPPADMDPECVALCVALNGLPGIQTIESCSGHGKDPFRVWFIARDLEVLPALCYWFDICHCGFRGWFVTVTTDCGRSPVHFRIEGPAGAYEQADSIAAMIHGEEESTRAEVQAEAEREGGLGAEPMSDTEVDELAGYLASVERAPGSGIGHLWPWGVPRNDELVRRLVATIEQRRASRVTRCEAP